MRVFIYVFFISIFFPAVSYAQPERQIELQCSKTPLPTVDGTYTVEKSGVPVSGWNYNRDLVAAAFGMFATASTDTYRNGSDDFAFDITASNPSLGWKKLSWNGGTNRYQNDGTGLIFDSYSIARGGCVFIVVAFRGTDESAADWFSNLSYVTGFLPLDNQYREASRVFPKIRAFAVQKFGAENIFIITTGHSLGGGLAEHIAQCFNDVAAVSFDPSFVTNSLFCRKRAAQIVRIHEDNEPFSTLKSFRKLIVKQSLNNGLVREYRMNAMELEGKKRFQQHSMLGLTAGMLRLNLNCTLERSKDCEIDRDKRAAVIAYSSQLYCQRLNETKFAIAKNQVTGAVKAMKVRQDPVCN